MWTGHILILNQCIFLTDQQRPFFSTYRCSAILNEAGKHIKSPGKLFQLLSE